MRPIILRFLHRSQLCNLVAITYCFLPTDDDFAFHSLMLYINKPVTSLLNSFRHTPLPLIPVALVNYISRSDFRMICGQRSTVEILLDSCVSKRYCTAILTVVWKWKRDLTFIVLIIKKTLTLQLMHTLNKAYYGFTRFVLPIK